MTSTHHFGDGAPVAAGTQPLEPGDTIPAEHVLENARLRLEIDPWSGCIASLYDKVQRTQVFKGLAGRAIVYQDDSDTWSHGVLRFDQVAGEFELRSLQLSESGPVKSVLRAISTYQASTLVQEFHLYHELDWVEVRVTVNWQEHNRLLKLRFPVNVAVPVATSEIPYGVIQRPGDGEEEPCQSWIDVSGSHPKSGETYGLSLPNDGKYSVDVQGSEIGLTVLRSPAYAHHLPAVLEPGGHYAYQDQGLQQFTYRLLPHAGGWQEAQPVQRAAELNQQPLALLATFHPEGNLPQADSFISVEPSSVVVTALKQAEVGKDLVLRAWETAGSPAQARLELPHFGRAITAEFGPFEIKTFLLPCDASVPIRELSLIEIDG